MNAYQTYAVCARKGYEVSVERDDERVHRLTVADIKYATPNPGVVTITDTEGGQHPLPAASLITVHYREEK